jgi:hypothetical protein
MRSAGHFSIDVQHVVRRSAADVSVNPRIPCELPVVVDVVRGGGELVLHVARKHGEAQAKLSLLRGALDAPRPTLGGSKRRQQQRREDGNDCNDHQQFDQGESRAQSGRPYTLAFL